METFSDMVTFHPTHEECSIQRGIPRVINACVLRQGRTWYIKVNRMPVFLKGRIRGRVI